MFKYLILWIVYVYKDNVHSLLVENKANTLSVSSDIEHNMNHVDQIGSL